MPRPGFVLQVDGSTPPILFSSGEQFRLEKLPADRSRVIYPPEPIAPLKDPDAAIRHALEHPLHVVGEHIQPLRRHNHFLLAAPDEEAPLRVELTDVAGVQPPLRVANPAVT